MGTNPTIKKLTKQSPDFAGNFLCFGTTGTRKDDLMLQMIHHSISAGENVLLIDAKGISEARGYISSAAAKFGRLGEVEHIKLLPDTGCLERSPELFEALSCGSPMITNINLQSLVCGGKISPAAEDIFGSLHTVCRQLVSQGARLDKPLSVFIYCLGFIPSRKLVDLFAWGPAVGITFYGFLQYVEQFEEKGINEDETKTILDSTPNMAFFRTFQSAQRRTSELAVSRTNVDPEHFDGLPLNQFILALQHGETYSGGVG